MKELLKTENDQATEWWLISSRANLTARNKKLFSKELGATTKEMVKVQWLGKGTVLCSKANGRTTRSSLEQRRLATKMCTSASSRTTSFTVKANSSSIAFQGLKMVWLSTHSSITGPILKWAKWYTKTSLSTSAKSTTLLKSTVWASTTTALPSSAVRATSIKTRTTAPVESYIRTVTFIWVNSKKWASTELES